MHREMNIGNIPEKRATGKMTLLKDQTVGNIKQ